LKYFLSDELKISARNARDVLHGICDELAAEHEG
jgi:hypothetical protein